MYICSCSIGTEYIIGGGNHLNSPEGEKFNAIAYRGANNIMLTRTLPSSKIPTAGMVQTNDYEKDE